MLTVNTHVRSGRTKKLRHSRPQASDLPTEAPNGCCLERLVRYFTLVYAIWGARFQEEDPRPWRWETKVSKCAAPVFLSLASPLSARNRPRQRCFRMERSPR